MKHCPVCNSARIKLNEEECSMSCDRCGYINKKDKNSEEVIKENGNN